MKKKKKHFLIFMGKYITFRNKVYYLERGFKNVLKLFYTKLLKILKNVFFN